MALHLFRVSVKPEADDAGRTYYVMAENHDQAAEFGRRQWFAQTAVDISTSDESYAEVRAAAHGTTATLYDRKVVFRRRRSVGPVGT